MKEILLTINGLNTTYIIWREGEFTEADVGIIGEHQSPLVIGMGETQGMPKLMSSNKEQVEPLENGERDQSNSDLQTGREQGYCSKNFHTIYLNSLG